MKVNKKSKPKFKKKFVLGAVAIVAVAAILLFLWQDGYISSPVGSDCTDDNTIKQLDLFQAGKYHGELVSGLPACIFKDLPPKPSDFDVINVLISTGQINVEDFCTRLGPEYWKQPDFYPNSDAFFNLYRNPIRDADGTLRRGVYGYGSYISELTASVTPGEEFSACVYLHSSWYTWTFQSLAFEPTFPDTASFKKNRFSDGNTSVVQQNASRYFQVEIIPKYMLLEPSYPFVFGNWSQKLTMNIKVSPDTPVGRYMLVISPTGQVPPQVDSDWLWTYKTSYVRSSGFQQDILNIGIEVT